MSVGENYNAEDRRKRERREERKSMAFDKREDTDVLWPGRDFRRANQRRNFRQNISFRVSDSWPRPLRNLYRFVGRQAMKFFDPNEMEKWVIKHKYLVTFMSVMFVVTWVIEVLVNVL